MLKSKTMLSSTMLLAASSVFFAGAAYSETIGYVGGTLHFGNVKNPDNLADGKAIDPSIEGVFMFPQNNGGAFVLDAMVRNKSGYDELVLDGEISEPQAQLAFHYLTPISEDFTLGGFVGHGITPFEDANEKHKVSFIGATGVYQTSDVVSVFGQVGYGTSPGIEVGGNGSAGFHKGKFIRLGVNFTGLQNTLIRTDLEYAASDEYEDANEPGKFWTFAVSGETPVGADGKWVATYGVRYAFFDAEGDPDEVKEVSINLGFRYMFGAGARQRISDARYVGNPYLPLRASFWTPAMD